MSPSPAALVNNGTPGAQIDNTRLDVEVLNYFWTHLKTGLSILSLLDILNRKYPSICCKKPRRVYNKIPKLNVFRG